jgi:cell division septal protein FtsQ
LGRHGASAAKAALARLSVNYTVESAPPGTPASVSVAGNVVTSGQPNFAQALGAAGDPAFLGNDPKIIEVAITEAQAHDSIFRSLLQ